jgi:hypothetical protein
LFANRLQSSREKYIENGFAHLAEMDFTRGHSAFEGATLIDREGLTPRVGRFVCSLLGWQQASFELRTILADYDHPFEISERFREVLHDTGQIEGAIMRYTTLVGLSPNSDTMAAMHAYLLWIDGQRTEALGVAQKLRDKFRDSPFAVMAEGMREQILRDRAAALGGEPSSG